jgi:hypothetical protein
MALSKYENHCKKMRRFPDAQKILEINSSTSTNKSSPKSLCLTCGERARGCNLKYNPECIRYYKAYKHQLND